MSAFTPSAADDALVPRLVLVGRPEIRFQFAKEVGAKQEEIFAPLGPSGAHGLRGPGVAVVCGPYPPERLDPICSLLRVQGFSVLTMGAPGVVEAARAHLGRFRRERSGQFTIETGPA